MALLSYLFFNLLQTKRMELEFCVNCHEGTIIASQLGGLVEKLLFLTGSYFQWQSRKCDIKVAD
jgi:hypothetical protein